MIASSWAEAFLNGPHSKNLVNRFCFQLPVEPNFVSHETLTLSHCNTQLVAFPLSMTPAALSSLICHFMKSSQSFCGPSTPPKYVFLNVAPLPI